MNGGNLFSCLGDLKSIIITPFPPYKPSCEQAQSTQSQPSNTSMGIVDPAISPSPPTLPVSSPTSIVTVNPSCYSSSSTTTTTASNSSSLSTSASSSVCSLRGEDRDLCKEDKDEAARPPAVEGENNSTIPENDLPSQFTRVMGKG